jgi:hypothetical protein
VDEGRGGLLPGAGGMTFLVCEDGSEYTDRFKRFLGAQFRFLRAGHFEEALALAGGADALLLDLDFRRTPRELLVDERGAPDKGGATEVQGIRSRGVALPTVLFADLDDAAHAARLERELAPLRIVPGSAGLPRIAQLLRELVSSATGNVEKS